MATEEEVEPEKRDAVAYVAPLQIKTNMVLSATASSRSYFSTWMLQSARRSADEASQIEAEHRGEWGEHALPLMQAAISCVIHSAAFLEAMINELYADAAHDGRAGGYLPPLSEEAVNRMRAYWGEGSRDDTLRKYRLVVSFAGALALDKGGEPYQSAALLLKLRNKLLHYKPESISHDTIVNIEDGLKKKFRVSALHPGEGAWWPHQALGAGCAGWATASAINFADEVSSRLGIVPNYQRAIFDMEPPASKLGEDQSEE